ncbi:MAG: Gfo/Idh/MocA family oxidoreductase [Thermomicrobiales bacterium]
MSHQPRPLRIIQAGLGGFGRSWADVVRVDGVERVAVVDPAPEARDWAVATLGLGADRCFATLDEALKKVPADAVLIVTPPETHHQLAKTALAAGKHVLTEKPLVTTLDAARDLVGASAAAHRILMVSQNYRFRPAAMAVREYLANDVIGALTAVRVRCLRDMRGRYAADNFRYLMRHPFVVDMSIHHFDLLRAVTGLEVESIYARGWRVPDSPFRYDPAVSALLTLNNGATVTYDGDWASVGMETSWNGEWEFTGERGRLRWTGVPDDAMDGSLTLLRPGSDPEMLPVPPLATADRVGALAAFRDAVASGEEPATSARDNIRSLAIVLGCIASIETGQVISPGA